MSSPNAVDADSNTLLLDYTYFNNPLAQCGGSSPQIVFFVAGWPDTHAVYRDNIVPALLSRMEADQKRATEDGIAAQSFVLVGITLPGFEESLSAREALRRREIDNALRSRAEGPTASSSPGSVRDVPHPTFGYSFPDMARMLGKTVRHVLRQVGRDGADDKSKGELAPRKPIIVCHDWGSVVTYELIAQLENAAEKEQTPTVDSSFFDRVVALDVGGNLLSEESLLSFRLLKQMLFYLAYQWFIILSSYLLPCGMSGPECADEKKNNTTSSARAGRAGKKQLPAAASISISAQRGRGMDRASAAQKVLGANQLDLASILRSTTRVRCVPSAVAPLLPASIPTGIAIPSVLTSSFLQSLFSRLGGRPLYSSECDVDASNDAVQRDASSPAAARVGSGSGVVVPQWQMAYPYVRTYIGVFCKAMSLIPLIGGDDGRCTAAPLLSQQTVRPLRCPTLFVCGKDSLNGIRFYSVAWRREVEKRSAIDQQTNDPNACAAVISRVIETRLGHWAFARNTSCESPRMRAEAEGLILAIVDFIAAH